MSKLNIIVAGERMFQTALDCTEIARRWPGKPVTDGLHKTSVVYAYGLWRVGTGEDREKHYGHIGAAYALADKWAEEDGA